MKNLKYIVFTILIIGSLSSCEDFLDQPPRGELVVGTFPVSESDALLATNACYNSLRAWHINTGGFPLLDIMADDTEKGSNPGDGTAIAPYDNFSHLPTEGSVERWYKTLYESIRRTNLVIIEVPTIDMDQDLANRYIAEARFLRAYYYGLLVRGFGDVPMVTEINPSLELGRTPVQQILDEIIYPDLENAIAVLPERSGYESDDLGRITKGAARGLLARIKLFYGEFTDVEALTQDIIDSDEYALVENFGEVFPEVNEFNEESVFEVGAVAQNFALGGNQYANTQGVRGTPNRGWGFARPSYTGLIQEYLANNDPRMEPSVLFVNETIDGILITGDSSTPDTTGSGSNIEAIECYNQKVWTPGTTPMESWAHNRRIIRYADILLMHAEALNENGKSQEALTYLNQVRARARGNNPDVLPDVTATSKDAIRDAIIQERKYEFALEGLRFWDLVRTGKAAEVLGPLGFIENKNELFPIPQSEVDISQGRITQNEGY